MIIIQSKKYVYPAGTKYTVIEQDLSGSLIASLDIEDDEEVRLDESMQLADDSEIWSYSVWLRKPNENDSANLDCLRQMCIEDPRELRFWFEDIPVGTWELLLEEGPNGDGWIAFAGIRPFKGGGWR